jgi:hypothetical protein
MTDTQTILHEDPVVLILAGQSQATEEDLATEARQALIRSTGHPCGADYKNSAQRILKRALRELKPKSNKTSSTTKLQRNE